jgi:hypothetical protein
MTGASECLLQAVPRTRTLQIQVFEFQHRYVHVFVSFPTLPHQPRGQVRAAVRTGRDEVRVGAEPALFGRLHAGTRSAAPWPRRAAYSSRQSCRADTGQYSRYRILRGSGKGQFLGPRRLSHPLMVRGGAPVIAEAPAISAHKSPSSSGSPRSCPAGGRWPASSIARMDSACVSSATGSDATPATPLPVILSPHQSTQF